MKKLPIVSGVILGTALLFTSQAYADHTDHGARDHPDQMAEIINAGKQGPPTVDPSTLSETPDQDGGGSNLGEMVDPGNLTETPPTNPEPPILPEPDVDDPGTDDGDDDGYEPGYDDSDGGGPPAHLDDRAGTIYGGDGNVEGHESGWDDEESTSMSPSPTENDSRDLAVPATAAVGGLAVAGAAFALGRRRFDREASDADPEATGAS